MTITKKELRILGVIEIVALTIYGEARGESIAGQCAVGSVIRNRKLKSEKPWNDICLAPMQFSCWNEDDPNYPMLLAIAEKLIKGNSPEELREVIWIAMGIVDGSAKDETNGARNYLTKNLFHSEKAPSWAKSMVNSITIGNHVFGTAV